MVDSDWTEEEMECFLKVIKQKSTTTILHREHLRWLSTSTSSQWNLSISKMTMSRHLVLLHLGSLLQPFDLHLVVGNRFLSLRQFAVLLLNQTVYGEQVGVQVLQHGLHGVGWIQPHNMRRWESVAMRSLNMRKWKVSGVHLLC